MFSAIIGHFFWLYVSDNICQKTVHFNDLLYLGVNNTVLFEVIWLVCEIAAVSCDDG